MSATAVAAKALSSRAVNAKSNVRVRARANPRATHAVVRRAIMSEEIRVSGENAEQYAEFASLLDQYQYNYKIGDVISGTVKACDAKGAWVEIGAKSEALCPTAEASLGNVRNVRVRLARVYGFIFFCSSPRRDGDARATSRRRRRAGGNHGGNHGASSRRHWRRGEGEGVVVVLKQYCLPICQVMMTKPRAFLFRERERLTSLCLCFPSRQQAASVFDIENTYDFEIIQDDNGEGCLTLSVRRMELAKAWDRCREAQADDAALTGEVLSVNRGGLLVEVEKLRGFVPQSHIGVRTLNREELIGQQLPFKFIEVDEEKNRLVLSHRLATDMVSAEGLEVGDVVEGMVQAVKPYGAFVDVGGQSGLLHISQISHERIVAVENVLSPGDRIKVLVMSKDAERGRLSLSTKKLEQNHGDMLRNPAAVFETAEEMGRQFKEKMAAAEGGMVMSTDEE